MGLSTFSAVAPEPAENSMGFHAPQELARILGEVIEHARQGQLEAERTTRRK